MTGIGRLDDSWFWHALGESGPIREIPWWKLAWTEPGRVSPDPAVRRRPAPTAEEARELTRQEQKPRRHADKEKAQRVASYGQTVCRELLDVNRFCLSHYCHKAHLLFADLLPLLEQYAYLEWMMHHDPAEPWYRDHLVHQLRVACLGDLLLGCPVVVREGRPVLGGLDPSIDPGNGATLLDRVTEILRGHVASAAGPADAALGPVARHLAERYGINGDPPLLDKAIVRAAWWMAALFHDTGYVFGFFAGIARRAREIYRFDVPDPLAGLESTFRSGSAEALFRFLGDEAEAFRRWLPAGGNAVPRPDAVPTAGMGPAFLVQLFRKGHAAPGALNLCYEIERLMERGELKPTFRFAAALAAIAILRHDTDAWRPVPRDPSAAAELRAAAGLLRERDLVAPDGKPSGWLVTRPIAFEDDPLSFLLALCDHLQEWARYKTDPHGSDRRASRLVYDFESVELELRNGSLVVGPAQAHDRDVPASTREHLDKEKRSYFGPDGRGGWLAPRGFAQSIEFKWPW